MRIQVSVFVTSEFDDSWSKYVRKKLLDVKEILEKDHIHYEKPSKCRKIHWFYGQYQDMFKDLKKSLGHDIYFREGLSTFQLNLSDIDPN